jgi:hypothetical protein
MDVETRDKVSQSLLRGFRKGRVPNSPGRHRYLYQNGDRVINMRSKSEALFAHQLDSLGFEWEFEPKKFDLGSLGTYTPDFFLPAPNKWIEVKGFWTDDSVDKKKFTEFSKRHDAYVVWARDVQLFHAWGPKP